MSEYPVKTAKEAKELALGTSPEVANFRKKEIEQAFSRMCKIIDDEASKGKYMTEFIFDGCEEVWKEKGVKERLQEVGFRVSNRIGELKPKVSWYCEKN